MSCGNSAGCDEAVSGIARRSTSARFAADAMNFGVALSDLGEFERRALDTRVVRLRPDLPDSHVNLGNVLARQGTWMERTNVMSMPSQSDPIIAEARRNRAYIWLTRGEFDRGWPEHEWRLKCAEQLLLPMNSPRWAGEDLTGRSILLVAEQGLGDTLQFIRFAAVVKERKGQVVVACPKPLMRIVARCPGVDRVVDWKSTLPDCDVHAPLLSLPAILGTSLANLPADPYLSVECGGREMAADHRSSPTAGRAAMARRARTRLSRSGSPGRGIETTRAIAGVRFHSNILLTSPGYRASG